MSNQDPSGHVGRYDIYMIRACINMPQVPEKYGPVPEHVLQHPPGVLYVGLPLTDAQRYLKALKNSGGYGWIAPARYRHPGISPEQGMAHAQEEFERLRTPGQAYKPIIFLRDEGVWWLYCAPRRAPIVDERLIPGHIYLRIDKLDGHRYTLKEEEQWAILSDV